MILAKLPFKLDMGEQLHPRETVDLITNPCHNHRQTMLLKVIMWFLICFDLKSYSFLVGPTTKHNFIRIQVNKKVVLKHEQNFDKL